MSNKFVGVKFEFGNVNPNVIHEPSRGSTSETKAYFEQVRRQVDEVIYKHNK